MTSAQVVETSVTNNSSFQNYSHPDDHNIRTTNTPGFKPFTKIIKIIDSLDPTDQKDNVRTESQLRVALILSERDTEFVVLISI